MEENNNKDKEPQKYTESFGTGVLSSAIFITIAFIVMYFLSKYFGN